MGAYRQMPFPNPPARIVPFDSGPVADHDIGRQFDEHSQAVVNILDFLKTVVRDDGVVRNGTIGPEQLALDLPELLAARTIKEVETLLVSARQSAAQAAQSAAEAAQLRNDLVALQGRIAASADAMARTSAEIREKLRTLAEVAPAPAATAPFPTGTLGPGAGGFYGVDSAGASATAQDWAQVAIEWAEHMPDTIPPNILAMTAVTGEHWSSRWWALKADAAFGALSDLYLGAWPTPPATDLNGGPITVGALYYDTTMLQPYVWTGTAWESFYAPMKAATSTLYYTSNANQSVFNVTVPDIAGHTGSLVDDGVMVYLNGVRLTPTQDYTIDTAQNTITLLRSQPAGAMIAIDILTPPSELAPGSVLATKLQIPAFDGVTSQFPMTVLSTAVNAAVQSADHLIVSLDGVLQNPGIAYTVAAPNTITFAAPPPPVDALCFIVWLQPPN
jgi:hypothetical protein